MHTGRIMMPTRSYHGLAFLALALAVTSAVAKDTKYRMVPIDLLPGLAQNSPNALSDKARVIGFGFGESLDNNVAYLWFKGGGGRPLPALPGAFNTWPYSINNRDEIVGQDLIGDPASPTRAGWFWKHGMKQCARLQPLRAGDQNVGVNQIDHAGRIVGYSGQLYGARADAVVWDSHKVPPTKLRGLPGLSTSARGINANRTPQIVGVGNLEGTETWYALLWRNPRTDPEVLPGLGGGQDVPVSINDHKQITGWSAMDPNDPFGTSHAVLWENGEVTDLAPDYPFSLVGNVNGINNLGQIVGTVVMEDGQQHAVLWQRQGQKMEMIDMNEALAEPSSCFLTYADGINDNGVIIVDAFDLNDPGALNRAFLLVPIN